MTDKIIKKCPRCSTPFTANEIINNDQIIPIGMTIDEENYEFAYYYFNHDIKNCKSTFMVAVEEFDDFVNADKELAINMSQNSCNEMCLDLENHTPCYNNCRWSLYRNFLSILILKKKTITP